MSNTGKPKLSVIVFSDYICPFCYIGNVRLAKLRNEFDLQVDWRPLEIHPDTPPMGRKHSELGYPLERRRRMSDNLRKMAEEEGLHLAERNFSANSHKALLLSEAAKEEDERIFYALHDSIFKAYFTEGQNISDPNVLQDLSDEAGVSEEIVHKAWRESRYEAILNETLELAAWKGINGVPTFIIGDRVVVGAVPTTTLLDTARGVHRTVSTR